MIHLYGVVDGLDELPAIEGLDGAPLERRQVEGLELVVSRTGREQPEVSDEAVLTHAQVVEELMARSEAILPARFGRAFAGEDELASAVQTKAAELERGLTRVRGCAELGLRVLELAAAPSTNGPRSGGEYMRRQLEETRRRERIAAEFHEPLAELAREETRFRGGNEELLAAAYLVPEELVAAFRERVERLEDAHPDLGVLCTGPWPPYSFAGEGEGEA